MSTEDWKPSAERLIFVVCALTVLGAAGILVGGLAGTWIINYNEPTPEYDSFIGVDRIDVIRAFGEPKSIGHYDTKAPRRGASAEEQRSFAQQTPAMDLYYGEVTFVVNLDDKVLRVETHPAP